MKFRIVLIASVAALAISACAGSNANSTHTPVASPSATATPLESLSPNAIAPSAAKAYRAALELSLASANSHGLTELWHDATGALVTVVAQAPNDGVCVQADLVVKDAQLIDAGGMMPSVLLDELAGLEANTGTDIGSVQSTKPGTFEVKNFVEDIHYVTIYTTDASGRIATALQSAEGEPAATATFTYSLTTEGKKAISDAK